MNTTIQRTEKILREFSGRKHAFLTGRGASALCVLYNALRGEGHTRVIIPSIACPSVLATVLICGLEPVIVDADRNLSIDTGRIDDVILPGDIVLGIHIFGIPADVGKITEICNAKNAVFIEDAAQAIGGKINGKPVGSFGRASIFSFAGGKILPTSGGGAVLTDDDSLAEKIDAEVRKLPVRPDDLNIRARSVRDALTASFNEARRDHHEEAVIWTIVFESTGDIYNYSINEDEAEMISRTAGTLSKVAAGRREKVILYNHYLNGLKIEHLEYPASCCPFRYTFILPLENGSDVQDCTETLRAEGLHASNLYVPLHWLAPGKSTITHCPRAHWAGSRVINLWVDDETSEDDIRKASGIISMWAG